MLVCTPCISGTGCCRIQKSLVSPTVLTSSRFCRRGHCTEDELQCPLCPEKGLFKDRIGLNAHKRQNQQHRLRQERAYNQLQLEPPTQQQALPVGPPSPASVPVSPIGLASPPAPSPPRINRQPCTAFRPPAPMAEATRQVCSDLGAFDRQVLRIAPQLDARTLDSFLRAAQQPDFWASEARWESREALMHEVAAQEVQCLSVLQSRVC
jgi:hypothetical protein